MVSAIHSGFYRRDANHLYVRSITSRIPVVGDYGNVAYPINNAIPYVIKVMQDRYFVVQRAINICLWIDL